MPLPPKVNRQGGFARARTALAQLEEKLRRQLGLVGQVGATFDPHLTPVLVVGDLRDAGNASNQGRAFALHFTGPIAVGNDTFSVRPEQDVFIDQVTWACTGAGSFDIAIFPPGILGSLVAGGLGGTWTDRKMVVGDQVPLTVSTGFVGVVSGMTIGNIAVGGIIQTNTTIVIPVNIMLPAQACISFRGPTGTTGHLGLRGRIWP